MRVLERMITTPVATCDGSVLSWPQVDPKECSDFQPKDNQVARFKALGRQRATYWNLSSQPETCKHLQRKCRRLGILGNKSSAEKQGANNEMYAVVNLSQHQRTNMQVTHSEPHDSK